MLAFAVAPTVALAGKVVVNKSVSVSELTVKDVRAIFTMQKRLWPNKRLIRVYVLPDSNPVHKEFVKTRLGMLSHQVRKIWDRMTFSGTGTAPVEVNSEQEMLDKIANTPDSIGYLNSVPEDADEIRAFEIP